MIEAKPVSDGRSVTAAVSEDICIVDFRRSSDDAQTEEDPFSL